MNTENKYIDIINKINLNKLLVIFVSFLLTIVGFIAVLPKINSVENSTVAWEAQIDFDETFLLKNDYVIFGEAPDASDGPPHDSHDTPKSPVPPSPYIRAYFDDGLTIPYDKLLKDYRHYPDDQKTWNLTVEWNNDTGTTMTISWTISEVLLSEYDTMVLRRQGQINSTWYTVANMFTENSFTWTHESYYVDPPGLWVWFLTDYFTINVQGVSQNTPPNTPSSPDPIDGETNVDVNADLSWIGGDPNGDPVTYDVFFGTTSLPSKVSSNQSITSYDPGTMDYAETYYWKIVAWDDKDATSEGSEWDFTTESEINNPPNTPSSPDPIDGETNVDVNADLSWIGGDPNGDPVTYDVFFGTTSLPSKVSSNQSITSYDPGTMDYAETYYWKIVAWDDKDATSEGSEWDFTTESEINNPPNTPSSPDPIDGETNVDVNADLSWIGGDPNGDPVTYDVFFGTTSLPSKVSSNQSITSYDPGTMDYAETYYWKIVAWDNKDTSTSGQTWSFATKIEQEILVGDMNGNGILNANDCRYLAKYIGGDPLYSTLYADGDVNSNGRINANDCRYLAKYISGDPEYDPLYPPV